MVTSQRANERWLKNKKEGLTMDKVKLNGVEFLAEVFEQCFIDDTFAVTLKNDDLTVKVEGNVKKVNELLGCNEPTDLAAELKRLRDEEFAAQFKAWCAETNVVEHIKQAATNGHSGIKYAMTEENKRNLLYYDERFKPAMAALVGPGIKVTFDTSVKEGRNPFTGNTIYLGRNNDMVLRW